MFFQAGDTLNFNLFIYVVVNKCFNDFFPFCIYHEASIGFEVGRESNQFIIFEVAVVFINQEGIFETVEASYCEDVFSFILITEIEDLLGVCGGEGGYHDGVI